MLDALLHDLHPALFRELLLAMKPAYESLPEQRARADLRGLAVPTPSDVARRDVELAHVPCEELTPRDGAQGGAVLYLHGGGYVVGSPRSTRHCAARLAKAAGCIGYVPAYRLAPENPYPAALEDALAVFGALSEDFGPHRIAICGDSAGAGLALALCLEAKARGAPLPACLHLMSPWVDLRPEWLARAHPGHKDVVCFPDEMLWMAASYVGLADAADPLVSPIFGDLAGLPPMLIQVGADERLLADSLRLAEKARAAGLEVSLQIAPEMQHVYPLFHRHLSQARQAIAEAGAWMRERTG